MDARRTSRAGTMVGLASLALLLLLLVPGVAAAGLKQSIAATLERYGMAGSGTSVSVYDLTAKRAIYQIHQDELRLPASNEKLVTSSTALADWTASFRFSTQVFVASPPDASGVVHGDVYLRGLGDPTLSTPGFQHHWGLTTSNVQDLVTALRGYGVTLITGRVVADEGYFDTQRSVSTWRPGMTEFCGPLSALTLNESSDGGGYVADPALAAAASLTRRLRAAGVPVRHSAAHGVAPATATPAVTETSATLGRVLAAMNKPSDNFLAEELLKGLGAGFGAGGTTVAGEGVATTFLHDIGIDQGFRLRDGSGLSYQDGLTTRTVLKILGAMSKRPDFPVFYASLAVAGVDGTLKDRMRHTAAAGDVHAKTGTLNDASSLSGYATTLNGHLLSFSMLMNGRPVPLASAHAAQDAVAVLLARSRP